MWLGVVVRFHHHISTPSTISRLFTAPPLCPACRSYDLAPSTGALLICKNDVTQAAEMLLASGR